MGLSAWKVLLVLGVVALLFLPRLVRMGNVLKDAAQRFDAPPREPEPYAGPTIDGRTGRLVSNVALPMRKVPLAERIGAALARVVKRISHRLAG